MAFSINPALQPAATAQYEGKNRSGKSITFDAIHDKQIFGASNTVGGAAPHALSAVVARYVVPDDCKLLRVALFNAGLSGAPTIQITAGDATNAAVVGLLNTPTTVTAQGALGQTIAPTAMDYKIPGGTILALRVATAANGWVSGLQVSVATSVRDAHGQAPVLGMFGPNSF